MRERKSGRSWRELLITVIVIVAAVLIIDRVGGVYRDRKCRDRVTEYVSEGNYASALMLMGSRPRAFADSTLMDECVDGLPEQGTVIVSGGTFGKDDAGRSC